MKINQDSSVKTLHFIDQLHWRYATKRMRTDLVVSQQKTDTIIEAIRLSASSLGLQPYHLIMIKDKQLLQKIKPIANNQPQITEATALLVFAVWDKATPERVNSYLHLIASERKVSIESLSGLKAMTEGILSLGEEYVFNWMARQAYIALGTGLVAAAMEEVDATPMEGFDPAGLDTLLDLPAKGLKSVALMTLGYRDEINDPIVKLKKVRRPTNDFVLFI